MSGERSVTARLAIGLTTLGPIGLHSRRPALLASALAAALFGFLPAVPGARVLAVAVVVVIAEAAVRGRRAMSDAVAGEIVCDRFAGMWCALVPLPHAPWALISALVVFRLLESRQVGPVRWASELAGTPRSVLDDVVAGLLTGVLLLGIYRIVYMV